MRILVVESRPGLSRSVRQRLEADGHVVVTCSDDDVDGPCRSLARPADCPLHEVLDLVVAVRVRNAPDALLEMGSVCAERRLVPVVRVDADAVSDDLERVVRRSVVAGRDRVAAAYASVVRVAFTDPRVRVEATQVRIRLDVPAVRTTPPLWAVIERSRPAMRDVDPFTR